MLASSIAKDVSFMSRKIFSSQSQLSTLENTSSSDSDSSRSISRRLASSSSSLSRGKRAMKDKLSIISNNLPEIGQTSLDIAESVSFDLSRNIESANLNTSNIVEEKRVRKSKNIANLALDTSLDDISKDKNLENESKIKEIFNVFAIITRSIRLHKNNLFSLSKQ